MSIIYKPYGLWAPPEDRLVLQDQFKRSPNNRLINLLTSEKFVDHIEWRLFEEWCKHTPESKHGEYFGQAFINLINRETHFELEREGYKWNDVAGAFEHNWNNGFNYDKTRYFVLSALGEKAIDLFKDWKDYLTPINGDNRELNEDLSNWITKVKSQSDVQVAVNIQKFLPTSSVSSSYS